MTNYLIHYGVLGMKWGVRRYQPYPKNHKGKFTGPNAMSKRDIKKTYKGDKKAISSALAERKAEIKAFKGDINNMTAKQIRKLDPSKLTNEQLQIANQRLNLESNFNKQTQNTNKGKGLVNRIVKDVTYEVGKKYVSDATKNQIDKLIYNKADTYMPAAKVKEWLTPINKGRS